MWLVYNNSLRKNEIKYTLKLLDSLSFRLDTYPL
jgi:hypothetical protein